MDRSALRRRVPGLGALALAALVAACGSFREAATDERTITVVVANRNFQDATVYVRTPSRRIRLGTVTGLETRTFRVAHTALGGSGFQLVADLVGSDEQGLTDRIVVQPGAEIEWTLESDLSMSSYTIW